MRLGLLFTIEAEDFKNDGSMGKFMDIKENLAFEGQSYILFPILKVDDAFEQGVTAIMFSKIKIKRRATTKMQLRKLILKT